MEKNLINFKLDILTAILDIAIAKGEAGFTEQDALSLGLERKQELIYHLEHLADIGFIVGEFIPMTFSIQGISPKSIRFVQGKITARGREYLLGLKQQEEIVSAQKIRVQ